MSADSILGTREGGGDDATGPHPHPGLNAPFFRAFAADSARASSCASRAWSA
jgi:hypothetical protein